MFIQNFNLRKRLGIGKLLEADEGTGAGAEGTEGSGEGDGDEKSGESTEEKTFTQADVDKMIKDRLAREKKGQLSKEEIKAYQDWKESQKTEEEKSKEALTNAEIKVKEAEDRATLAETKVTCLSKGVKADSIDDVVILAKAMVSDDVTIDQAIDKVLEKYPALKGESKGQEDINKKGFQKIGAGGEKKTTEGADDKLLAAFGIKNKK